MLHTGYNSFPNRIPKSCLLQAHLLLHGKYTRYIYSRISPNAFDIAIPCEMRSANGAVTRAQRYIYVGIIRENPLILNGTWVKCANQMVRFMNSILNLSCFGKWKEFSNPVWMSGMCSSETTGVYVGSELQQAIYVMHLENFICSLE